MTAPTVPRLEATELMAVLISLRAVVAFVTVVMSAARARPALDSVPTVVVMVLFDPPSLRKMDVVDAEKTDVPLNVVLAPIRSTSALIEVYSAFSAVRWEALTVPVAD